MPTRTARQSVLRLIDANANRAMEGLRVCEDLMRFHLQAPQPVRRLRALRHAIAAALRGLPVRPVDLIRARGSRRDVGRRARGGRIDTLERMLLVNLQRAKESLRVLEECARLLAPRQTARFQSLRFRTYEVERELLIALATLRDRRRRSR